MSDERLRAAGHWHAEKCTADDCNIPKIADHPHDGYAYDGCKCVCCVNIRALAAAPAKAEGSDETLRAALEGIADLSWDPPPSVYRRRLDEINVAARVALAATPEQDAATRKDLAAKVADYQRRKASEYVGHADRIFDAVLAILSGEPKRYDSDVLRPLGGDRYEHIVEHGEPEPK